MSLPHAAGADLGTNTSGSTLVGAIGLYRRTSERQRWRWRWRTPGAERSLCRFRLWAILSGELAGPFFLASIPAGVAFTAWGILTGGKARLLDRGGWNYTCHELTIGAVAQVVLLATGHLASLAITGPADGRAFRRSDGVGVVEAGGTVLVARAERRQPAPGEGQRRYGM